MREIFGEIKARVKLGEYLTNYYGLEIKSGMALCPLHKDQKTRSFHVINEERWYCFGGCGGGDVIEFVQKKENLSLMDAVRKLADQVGVRLDPEEEKRIQKFKELRDRTQKMLDKASSDLSDDMGADLYLKSRGLTPDAVKHFGLGFRLITPSMFPRLLKSPQGTISFPIHDQFNRLVGYSMRLLEPGDDLPKYVNSCEDDYGLFRKKEILYNLGACRPDVKKRIFICEGYFDVIALWMLGFKNSVGICQAIMTKEQAKVLHEAIAPETEIVLVPDTDKPGIDAMSKNIKLLRAYSQDRPIRVAFINGEKDVSDAFVKLGAKATRDMVEATEPAEIALLEQMFKAEPDRAKQYQMTRPVVMAVSPLLRDDCIEHLSTVWNKDRKFLSTYFGVEQETADEHSFVGAFDLVGYYADYIVNIQKHGIRLGIPGFDRIIRRVAPGEVAYIQARTSVGKTALLLNILGRISSQGIPVLFFSLEQQKEQIFERCMQIANSMGSSEIERLTSVRDPKLHDAHNNYYRVFKNLYICDKGALTLKQIMEHILRFSAIHVFPPLVAIDYFGYVKSERRGGVDIYEESSERAKNIKACAKELNNCWLVLHQLSRAGGTGGEPVTLDMGRDSGVIEESADLVIGAWRPELAKNLKQEDRDRLAMESAMEAAVLKQRSGPTGNIKLSFNRRTLQIADYHEPSQGGLTHVEEHATPPEQMDLSPAQASLPDDPSQFTQDPEQEELVGA